MEPHVQQLVRFRSNESRNYKGLSADELPQRDVYGPRKSSYWGGRWDNESVRYNVLRRVLRSSVGRPWDKVYSHILTKFKRSRHSDRLALDRLSYTVERNCTERVIDGRTVVCDSEGKRLHGGDFYVHPRTGVLGFVEGPRMPYPAARYDRPQEEITILKVGKKHYRKLNGVWFEITMRKLPDDNYPSVHDVVMYAERKQEMREAGTHPNNFAAGLTRWDYTRKYGSAVYAAAKRQLNKRELRALIYPRIPADTLPTIQ